MESRTQWTQAFLFTMAVICRLPWKQERRWRASLVTGHRLAPLPERQKGPARGCWKDALVRSPWGDPEKMVFSYDFIPLWSENGPAKDGCWVSKLQAFFGSQNYLKTAWRIKILATPSAHWQCQRISQQGWEPKDPFNSFGYYFYFN